MMNHTASHELTSQNDIYNYLTGGRGIVTLKSHTGVHHTYVFESPGKPAPNNKTLFIKTLVSGSEWIYVGMYRNGTFHLTKASKFKADSAIVKGVIYIMKLMHKPGFHDERMQLFHEGVCSRCGRPLTNPESIKIGLGPYCRDLL